jgi:hypothetical protein
MVPWGSYDSYSTSSGCEHVCRLYMGRALLDCVISTFSQSWIWGGFAHHSCVLGSRSRDPGPSAQLLDFLAHHPY